MFEEIVYEVFKFIATIQVERGTYKGRIYISRKEWKAFHLQIIAIYVLIG